jgi:hypothetical protein
MKAMQLLQSFFVPNVAGYDRDSWMNFTESLCEWSRPITSSNHSHAGCCKAHSTNPEACTKFQNVPEIITNGPLVKQGI